MPQSIDSDDQNKIDQTNLGQSEEKEESSPELDRDKNSFAITVRKTWQQVDPRLRRTWEKVDPKLRKVWDSTSPIQRRIYLLANKNTVSIKLRQTWEKIDPAIRKAW